MSRIANRVAIAFAALAVASGAALLQAKADPLPVKRLAPPTRTTQAGYYVAWPAACPFGSHYTCWHGTYGGRYCGCWLGGDHPACPSGYYYTCRPDAFGGLHCACY